jgi:hypothetical protein
MLIQWIRIRNTSHVPESGVKQVPDLEPCLASVLEAKGMIMPMYLIRIHTSD